MNVKVNLNDVETGYLYLDEVRATGADVRGMDGDAFERCFVAEFSNETTSVSFTVSDKLLPVIIGCDAISVQISTVHTTGGVD